MKKLLRELYSLSGKPDGERMAQLKTDLFGNGATPGITIDTAATDGILISSICADGLHISGANTANAIHISGDQVIGILYDVTAAATDGLKIAVPTGITLTDGIDMTCAGTGTITNAINIGDASALTNLFKFNEVAGCILPVDVSPSDTPSDGGLGADACIRVDINGQDYFIPLFAVELSS